MDVLEAIATTRAIRRYRPQPIPEEDLATILWHATRAPSGSNRQPTRFVVLRDGPTATEAKALLGEAFRRAWNTKRSTDSYDAGSGVDGGSPKARIARTMQAFVDHFEETPVVVLQVDNPDQPGEIGMTAEDLASLADRLLALRQDLLE